MKHFVSQITFVDFVMYELLDQHFLFEPTILDDYPNLKVHSCSYIASSIGGRRYRQIVAHLIKFNPPML